MHFHLSGLPEVQSAIEMASRCTTWNDLVTAMERFDAHPLCSTPLMPGRAGIRMPDGRPVMMLGKSPPGGEKGTRIPFSGPASLVLREEMGIAGFDLDACWMTCATPWRARRDDNPNATQLAISRPFLFKEIEIIDPCLIVALGQKADEALFQRVRPIGDRLGMISKLDIGGIDRIVLTMESHAHVMYGRAERAKGFQRRLSEAAREVPLAFDRMRMERMHPEG